MDSIQFNPFEQNPEIPFQDLPKNFEWEKPLDQDESFQFLADSMVCDSGSGSGSGSGGASMSSYSATKNGGSTSRGSQPSESNLNTRLANLVAESAIIVVATRGCCMCLVVKHLLLGLGVNPTIFDVDAAEEAAMLEELSRIEGGGAQEKLPAVFVGGKLLGGVEKVMETHISGELVPLLKQAWHIFCSHKHGQLVPRPNGQKPQSYFHYQKFLVHYAQ